MAVYTKRDFEVRWTQPSTPSHKYLLLPLREQELRLVYPAVASLFRSTFLSVTPAKVHSALSIPPAFEDEIDRVSTATFLLLKKKTYPKCISVCRTYLQIFWPQDTTNINTLPKM